MRGNSLPPSFIFLQHTPCQPATQKRPKQNKRVRKIFLWLPVFTSVWHSSKFASMWVRQFWYSRFTLSLWFPSSCGQRRLPPSLNLTSGSLRYLWNLTYQIKLENERERSEDEWKCSSVVPARSSTMSQLLTWLKYTYPVTLHLNCCGKRRTHQDIITSHTHTTAVNKSKAIAIIRNLHWKMLDGSVNVHFRQVKSKV